MGGFKPGAGTALVNATMTPTETAAGEGLAVSVGGSALIANEWQTWHALQVPPE